MAGVVRMAGARGAEGERGARGEGKGMRGDNGRPSGGGTVGETLTEEDVMGGRLC